MFSTEWRCITLGLFCLVGCTTSRYTTDGQRLVAAGFVQRPSTAQELNAIPSHTIVPQSQGKNATYIYADPIYCRCVYTGDRQAYRRFQDLTILQHQAEQEKATNALEIKGSPINFTATSSPPSYWFPTYYPYYYPTAARGMGLYSPNWYPGR